ncbi:MAG: TetR/AcrR family transcriptional regulator [Bacteroidota bacterium]|nr:TetR/AcrR family transcriptional regulator [Bacteroidota bacterium]
MIIDKKEHIINAAIELFAEKGFEGTSIRDLAAKADVNIAMVNYYFGSKDKLFEALIEHKASYMRERLEEITADKSKSDIEKLDVVIETYVNRILSQRYYHRIIHQEIMLKQREEVHNNIISIFSKNTEIIKNIIEHGIRKKVFKKVDPELTFATILGTINQVTLSKSLCNQLMNKDKNFNPYNDENFKKRIITHLKQLIHSLLIQH